MQAMEMKKIKAKKILFVFSLMFYFFSGANLFAQCEIGAFVGNGDHRAPYASEIQNFENLAGRHIASDVLYWAWNDGGFPAADLNSGLRYHDGYDTKATLQMVWEPWGRGDNDIAYDLTTIINGSHDSYITKFAQDCRDWSDPIRLRFAHEMIDDNNPFTAGWYPWQDRPTEYVAAWNHVHDIFNAQGATNVEFVWAPNHHSNTLSVLENYYPGKDSVDWLGMDGYNWGYYTSSEPWGYWLSFDEIFLDLYNTMKDHPEVFGDKKMMISEFASAEFSIVEGKTKAQWIEETFKKIKSEYSEIEAFYWFNALKERDWRIDSSQETLLAFQTALQDTYFTSHLVPEPSTLLCLGTGLLCMLAFVNKSKYRKGGSKA